MKKIVILGILILPLFFSCKKVLETSPYNAIPSSTAFSTEAYCDLSMLGVYDAAQSGLYTDGSRRGYPFGSANIEQGDVRGEDVVNVAAFYQITYQSTYNSSSANNVAMWKGLYALINEANVCINGFHQALAAGIISSAKATQYEAECRFLRAMAHHEALIHFARPYMDGGGQGVGVPYRDSALLSSAAVATIFTKPRMRTDSVYVKMLADLDYAETNLPVTAAVYRTSKAAAIALKMRLKLHMGDWAGVITEGNKLIPATAPYKSPIGGFALTTAPDGPFVNNASTESMFSIKNDALDNPGTNAALSRMYGSASINGRGLVAISPVIYNDPRWLCDDKRRSLLLVTGTNANGNKSYFSTKYRDYTTYSDYAPQIRYAEVLLTMAEAVARNSAGVSAQAVALLDAVRDRSLGVQATQTYTIANFAAQTDLVKAILFERRIEFLAEGKRWSDISRLSPDAPYSPGGIPAKAVNGADGLAIYNCGAGYTPGQAAIPYADFRFLWPIPATEITQNPIITQNPLY